MCLRIALLIVVRDEQEKVGNIVRAVAVEICRIQKSCVGRDFVIVRDEQEKVGNISEVVVVAISGEKRGIGIGHIASIGVDRNILS